MACVNFVRRQSRRPAVEVTLADIQPLNKITHPTSKITDEAKKVRDEANKSLRDEAKKVRDEEMNLLYKHAQVQAKKQYEQALVCGTFIIFI